MDYPLDSDVGSPARASDHFAVASSRALAPLGMCVALGLLVFGAVAAYSARQDAWRQAEQQSRNLLLTLQRDIGRNITVFDLSLQGVIEALAIPGLEATTPAIKQHTLFDRAAGAEDLGSIVVFGPDGKVVQSSVPVPDLDASAREEFVAHRDHLVDGLYIGHAARSWLDPDKVSITLSRGIYSPDGKFAGVVSGELLLSYFGHLFQNIDVGPGGQISLIRADGRNVWRYPSPAGDFGADYSATTTFSQMATALEGHFVAASGVDGVTRFYRYSRIGALPLILSVNLSVDDIFARWRQKAEVIGPILLAMCGIVILISLLFRREIMRRADAEKALGAAVEQLSQFASTDALTGLANRRTLQSAVEREWRRAERKGTIVGLLMIDADHFKSFNDLYGHQAGDGVLSAVARAISASAFRPADLAARYGGEEFVVLLPETDEAQCKVVAERIRTAVEALAIPHLEGSKGVVTVSIGVGVALPCSGDRPSELVAAADQALYASKRNGRNQVLTFRPLARAS